MKTNKQPSISQHMPTIAIQQTELNRIELYNKLTPSAYKLWMALLRHMMSLTVKGVHGKSTILRTNKLTIDPQFLFDHDVVIADNYKLTKEANRNARKLTKELVKANVLTPLEKKDDFIINPLFFYKGDKYGDCYKEWCRLSTTAFEQQYNADYSQRLNNLNAWVNITDPELTAKEDKEREEKIAKLAKERQEKQLKEQQEKQRKERIAYYKDNPTTNHIINKRCIEELGLETASTLIEHKALVIACEALGIEPPKQTIYYYKGEPLPW